MMQTQTTFSVCMRVHACNGVFAHAPARFRVGEWGTSDYYGYVRMTWNITQSVSNAGKAWV
jgi:hypothetical protein